jgi:hypothetical protein
MKQIKEKNNQQSTRRRFDLKVAARRLNVKGKQTRAGC